MSSFPIGMFGNITSYYYGTLLDTNPGSLLTQQRNRHNLTLARIRIFVGLATCRIRKVKMYNKTNIRIRQVPLYALLLDPQSYIPKAV